MVSWSWPCVESIGVAPDEGQYLWTLVPEAESNMH
jgi:hypothetical protein